MALATKPLFALTQTPVVLEIKPPVEPARTLIPEASTDVPLACFAKTPVELATIPLLATT